MLAVDLSRGVERGIQMWRELRASFRARRIQPGDGTILRVGAGSEKLDHGHPKTKDRNQTYGLRIKRRSLLDYFRLSSTTEFFAPFRVSVRPGGMGVRGALTCRLFRTLDKKW